VQEGNNKLSSGSASSVIHGSVISSYLAKAIGKGVAGLLLLSPPLVTDALHSTLDIAEHLVIWLAGRHARTEDRERYPLGRMPLLDLIGFTIGLSVTFLAFTCLCHGLGSLLVLSDLLWGLSSVVPEWIRDHVFPSHPAASPGKMALAGTVFLASGALSWAVYVVEKSLAESHGLREYVSDAEELRNDGLLELTVGAVAIVAVGVTYLLPAEFDEIYAASTGAGFLVLTYVIGRHGIRELAQNYRSLMNPGLDAAALDQLREHVNHNLPVGCSLAQSNEASLVAFVRGDDIFVSGTLKIERGAMSGSDTIIEDAKMIVEGFLSSRKNVVVQFSVESDDPAGDIQRVWRRLLTEVWNVGAVGDLAEAYFAAKRGELRRAGDLLDRVECASLSTCERQLALWIRCQDAQFLRGAQGDRARAVDSEVSSIRRAAAGDASSAMLAAWQLEVRSVSGRIAELPGDEQIRALCAEMEAVARAEGQLPAVVRAEAAFMLGLSWERRSAYDVDAATGYYRLAARLYAESGMPSEADRLWNTWGHQKTLLYELKEAVHLLERSRRIKQQKGDRVGLAFASGCLADACSRLGQFARADELYGEDLAILHEIGAMYGVVGVLVKRGEASIRRGVVSRESSWINEGVQLCREAHGRKEQNPFSRFFGLKGIAKGLLWLAAVSDSPSTRIQRLEEARRVMREMRPASDYTEAFILRLQGRLAGLQGDGRMSRSCLRSAADRFASMRRSVASRHNSLQSIVCRLEEARFKAVGRSPDPALMRAALTELTTFVAPFGGLLGEARTFIDEGVDKLETVLSRLEEDREEDSASTAQAMITMTQEADCLIAFLES